jgi:hypothetical protein
MGSLKMKLNRSQYRLDILQNDEKNGKSRAGTS